MRDLMASQRQQSFKKNVSREERETLHDLMTADIFDEVAFVQQQKNCHKRLLNNKLRWLVFITNFINY